MRLILFSFFVVISSSLFSQNWEIYKNGDRLLYYEDNYGYDSTAVFIRADSVIASGGDSIIYLNKKVNRTGSAYYLAGNIPFPFQKRITRYANGSWQFSDTANWVLRPADPLSSSWIFDTLHGINATITSIAYGMVLGQPDSIKTISLSNGDSILVSKHHSIIRLPSTMTGTPGKSLAGFNQSADDSIPGYQRIFNFHAGDLFEYKKFHYHYIQTTNSWYTSYVRDSIMSVQSDTNGITCTIYRWKVDTAYGMPNPPASVRTHGIITKSYNAASYDYVNNNANHSLSASFYFTFAYDAVFQCKTKNYFPRTPSGTNDDVLIYTESNSPNPQQKTRIYGENFGAIQIRHTSSISFPTLTFSTYDSTLIGAYVNNRLYGTMHDTSYFLWQAPPAPTSPPPPVNPFSFQQTIAEDFVIVRTSVPTVPATVELYDLAGQLMLRQNFTGSTELNIRFFANGVYVVRVYEYGFITNQYKLVHISPEH